MESAAQESDPINSEESTLEAGDVTADGASSPDATVEVSEEDQIAQAVQDEFYEKFGEPEDAAAEVAEAPEAETTEVATNEEPNEAEPVESEITATDNPGGYDIDKYRVTAEEFKALPETARNRIGHLNTIAKKLVRENETFADGHNRFNQLRDYCLSTGFKAEDIGQSLTMIGERNSGNHTEFLKYFGPMVDESRQALGETISPDLQDQVDLGEMTESAAQELAKSRIAAKEAQRRAELAESRQQESNAQTERQQNAARIVEAANARELELRAVDPDYQAKSEAISEYVREQVSGLVQNGVSPTPEMAASIVTKAHAFVSKQAAPTPPAPRPTPPTPKASQISRAAPAKFSNEQQFMDHAATSYVPANH